MTAAAQPPVEPQRAKPNYEGYCQFCKREIGTGHEPGCVYYRPKRGK